MIEFGIVPFHTVASEIAPNVARHYSEMNKGDDYGTPRIDWDLYLQLSLAGQCVCVTAREEQKLVGYSVYSLGFNPRYKDILEASSDGVFLEKEHRGQGIRFLKTANKYLNELGVKEINYITNDEAFGALLERLGSKSTYKIWSFK